MLIHRPAGAAARVGAAQLHFLHPVRWRAAIPRAQDIVLVELGAQERDDADGLIHMRGLDPLRGMRLPVT